MLANDLRRLAEEIAGAYEERVQSISDAKKETLEQLAVFKSELKASSKERTKSIRADLKDMSTQLRAELSQFMSDLNAAEDNRKSTTQADLKDMADRLRENLASFVTDMSASVADIMGEFNRDRSEAAQAWHEILSVIRSATGAMTLTTPEEPAPTSEPESEINVPEDEETLETQDAQQTEVDMADEQEEDEAPEDSSNLEESEAETLHNEIVSLLQDSPDGLRMVEIAEEVGVENWRSLIPIMRELLGNGEIKKEDSTYFTV